MSKSRGTNNLPKWQNNNFNHTHDLHQWLNDCFNDPLYIIPTTSNMDLSAVNMQPMFNQLLRYNDANSLPLLRQRSTSKQNILHFLFSWKLDRDHLRKINKKRGKIDANAFSKSQHHNIYYRDELKEKAKLIYPEKKEMLFTDDEYNKITSLLIQEKVFYFDSLEKYYEVQLLNLINALFTTLSTHSEIITSMLLERDKNGLTPLHCLASHSSKDYPVSTLFNLMMKHIKPLPETDKSKILHARDTQDQRFLHKLCRHFSPNIGILCDAFGDGPLVVALLGPDKNYAAPLHLACEYQKKSLVSLFQLINTCKLQISLRAPDSSGHTPLAYLAKNKHFTDNDISLMLSELDLDTSIIDQNITLQTPRNDTLLTLAIAHNRYSIIKAIQQHASEHLLLQALLTQNNSGQHALEFAYSHGDLVTFKLTMQLYLKNESALLGILAASPLDAKQPDPKHFSRFDATECLKEFLNIDNIFKLATIFSSLIKPKHPANNDEFIKEFVEACVCIAQHRPQQKQQSTGFTFFPANPLPNLDKKIAGVTPEQVDLYFKIALPMIKPYVSKEKQKHIEMILSQFNAKMHESTSILAPATLLALQSSVELQPIYDHDLESKWRNCWAKERDLAERKSNIKSKITTLREWEKRLNQHESFQPEKTITPPFMLTNALAKSKVIETHHVQPQIVDALEYRRQECKDREAHLQQKENVVAQREKELSHWELKLLKREEEMLHDQMNYQQSFNR